MNAGWYFTAPWNAPPIRRGDALGFRAGADYFADLIAPGLSNGTSDARWISLLSWCLKWSHIAWKNSGGDILVGRDDQLTRYAWMRPLELLWVDRTLDAEQTTGQLRGRRSIERWRNAGRKLADFGMSPDQFRRFRQVGTYGAYRVVFRTVSDLTTGDGWTPGNTALELADLVNQQLPLKARLKENDFESKINWGSWRDQETRFWTERGWPVWKTKANHGFLPTTDDAARKPLPSEERSILEPALFGAGSIRRATAEVLAGAKKAKSHADLCDALANSTALALKLEPASLMTLPVFTRLADAAMDAMRGLWKDINQDPEKQAPSIEKLARSDKSKKLARSDKSLKDLFDELRDTSKIWLEMPNRKSFPHDQVVTRLAEAICQATSLNEQIRALTKHHQEYAGGRRWFREQAGNLEPLLPDTGIAATNYRFRLRAICLLAAQCGVSDMKAALDALKEDLQ